MLFLRYERETERRRGISPLSIDNDMLILFIPDHPQEPYRAIGHAPVDRIPRDARSVDDLARPVLPRVRGSELLNDAHFPRR